MIRINSVNKKYKDSKGIHDLSFCIDKGEPLALLGKNGAGKTTTIKTLLGIINCDNGSINIPSQIKVSYLPEERGIYNDLTVEENMKFFSKIKGLGRKTYSKEITNLVKEFQIEEYLNFKVSLLSKGNVQKLQLAIALLGDPELLVLDEPFSGLDPINRELFIRIIKKRIPNTYMLLSSHQLDIVGEICKKICILDKGHIKYFGSKEDFLQSGTRTFEVKNNKKVCISKKMPPEDVKDFILKNTSIFNDKSTEIRYEYPSLQEMYVELLGGD